MDGRVSVEETMEFVTPAAPIGAELEKNGFVFFFGLFQSLGELLLGVGGFVVDGRFGCVCGVAEPRERGIKEQEETEKQNGRRRRLHSFRCLVGW